MSRAIFSLWRYMIWDLIAICSLVFLAFVLPIEYIPAVGVLAITVLVLVLRSRWRWHFAKKVLGFRTIDNGHVVLHYSPALNNLWDIKDLQKLCHNELFWVARRLEETVRGRPAIFLFASHQEIATIFGSHVGGTVLSTANAIVVAVDNFLRESVRHEFGHLFSERWNRSAPPLFREGLSVWLQETLHNEQIDIMAWPWLSEHDLKLERLLSQSFFFSEPHRDQCYILAGSFTGYLIRRFGWQEFRRLFQIKNTAGYRGRFHECLGISLEAAEKQWRKEVKAIGPLSGPL